MREDRKSGRGKAATFEVCSSISGIIDWIKIYNCRVKVFRGALLFYCLAFGVVFKKKMLSLLLGSF